MNCLILAAGFGSRLKELTKDKPKAMIEIKGEMLLDTQIKAALAIGVENVYIVSGYKFNLIDEHVRKKYDHRVKIIHNFQFANSNSAFSWLLAAPYIFNKPYLHLNCDVLFTKDTLVRMVQEFKKENNSIIACRNDLTLNNAMEQIIVDDKNILKACINKFNKKLSGKAFGMCIFTPKENKKHFKILAAEISNGNFQENFFKAIRLNCLNSKYKAIWFDKKNIHEFNDQDDLLSNNI